MWWRGDLSELFSLSLSLSLSLQILIRFKKSSCYCVSLPSSCIPIFPPPPLTPLNYITIDQNSEPTSFTHSFIHSFLLVSAHHFSTYHHHDGSPEYLGISGNMEHREMGSQGNENPTSWMFDEYNLMEDISVTSLLDPTGVFASTSWPSPPPHLSFSNPTSLRWSLIPFLLCFLFILYLFIYFFFLVPLLICQLYNTLTFFFLSLIILFTFFFFVKNLIYVTDPN